MIKVNELKMKYPKVSIIIPTYNEEKNIEECLDTLMNQDHTNYEIIVVDGGSTDRTVEIIKKYPVKLIIDKNGNIPHSRNIGWKNSKGNFVAYIDGDCEADKCWLKKLVECLYNNKDKKIAGIGGSTRTPEKASDFIKSLGIMLNTWWGGIGSAQGTNFKDEKEVESIPNCNALYHKNILKIIGGFDENFDVGEDFDLNFRIRKNGYRLIYTPKAIVYHKMRSNLRKWCKRMFEYGKARTKIIKKHPSSFKPIYLIPLIYVVSLIFFPVAYFISNSLFKFFLLVVFIFLSSSIIFSLSTYPKHRKVKYIGLILVTYISSVISYGIGFLYGVLK